MKRAFRPVFCCMLCFCVVGIFPTRADLYQIDSAQFGANSLTVDSRTGLTWLNLPFSAGLSYQQALADTAPGGIFYGYRFATEQEVFGLFASAGIPTTGYYSTNNPAIASFISLIGPTGTENNHPMVDAIASNLATPAIYVTGDFGSGTVNSWVYWVNDATTFGPATSASSVSDWLVAVPEPGTCAISLAGFALFVVVRRVKGGSR